MGLFGKKKICPNCGKKIDADAVACPKCGKKFGGIGLGDVVGFVGEFIGGVINGYNATSGYDDDED
jgi:hypothetical protein